MRKTPRQERSRQMVERILAAGRKVLVEHGYDAFSTNRVATTAGISPGSLYQYFPDKAAILELVVDRYWDEVAESVAAALADRLGIAGAAMARETADALISALEADPALLRVVAEELPLARNRTRRAALEKRVRELAAAYLLVRPERSRRPDPTVAAWVIVLAMENLALRWVLDQPPIAREVVLAEMTALIGGYLLEDP
ncbi:TetR/AcrR family transcriptional regulator [Nocardioides sp. BP30]|uniref:TetR/AcrR family transcriptional regulator n=1 Tax=Nocardioides sp. BP30 TaxID=3036374 RepID=UPI0024689E87|nr:TetR/AcrR family transcriptional regulator [Nocardioides sp. BP30]WGL53331.1 TetR/AcrR family transcriptional regulator [Nocardioides sp. BP30]